MTERKDKIMKIIMFANGSSENHGCEAIKKTTMKLLGENEYYIGTTNIHYEADTSATEYIQYTFKKKYSIWERVLCRLGLMKNAKGKLQLEQFQPYFDNCDLAISVGGDNYCYGDSEWLYYLHDMASKREKPSVLWGASLEESLIDEEMEQDFKKFNMIIVRESISYDALKRRNLANVYLCPDPAFCLEVTEPKNVTTSFSNKKKYIGINISPLVERKELAEGIFWKNVQNTIRFILEETDYDVMLIPHVVTSDNNDYELLAEYKRAFPQDRVILIDDQPCDVLKYYISKCDFMIAARTHASIASYSQCIPTLVIGYSVKSRGIAKDLFGTDENYVISIDKMISEKSLLDAFIWMFERKESIHKHLEEIMPEYIKKTSEMAELIRQEIWGK